MSWRKITRDPADAIFSRYIRTRDGWRCKRCLKQFEEGAANLHNSHFWGRARESTRFDPENCDAMCSHCHDMLGRDPELHREWKLQQLGEQAFMNLRVRAEARCKKDRKGQAMYWKLRLKSEYS